jgi:hypothetical protein
MFFKNIIILLLVYSILIFTGCGKKEAPVAEKIDPFFFKIQFLLGDVKISDASGDRTAVQGDQLKISDAITTGEKAAADLVFGTSGVIRVNQNSRVTVSAIADKAGSETVIDMDNGRLFLTLSKLEGTRFNVKTPTAVASVRGTSFTVASGGKGAKLSVINGTVAVNPVLDGNIIENKSIDVESGNRTDYIDRKTVERIVNSNIDLPVMPMTVSEKLEIKNEIRVMKIEEMPELSLELKKDIEQIIKVEPASVEVKDSVKKPEVRKDDRGSLLKKQAEEQKRKEEEQVKNAEEKRKKEEQVKKDRVSNIPTL